jgi:hypothetical protein
MEMSLPKFPDRKPTWIIPYNDRIKELEQQLAEREKQIVMLRETVAWYIELADKDAETTALHLEIDDCHKRIIANYKHIVTLRTAMNTAIQATKEGYIYNFSCELFTEALAATQDLSGYILCDAEPVAWSTFDGEGGYDYRSYIDNEDYLDRYRKLNSSSTYFNWVEPLYKARKQP